MAQEHIILNPLKFSAFSRKSQCSVSTVTAEGKHSAMSPKKASGLQFGSATPSLAQC